MLLLALICLVAAEVGFHYTHFPAPAEQKLLLEQHIRERGKELDQTSEAFRHSACRDLSFYTTFPTQWQELSRRNDIAFIGYSEQSVYFWSDNSVPISTGSLQSIDESTLLKLKNGWYLVRRYEDGPCTLLGLALISREYSYQNDYLQNGYPGLDDLPSGTRLLVAKEEGALPLMGEKDAVIAWLLPDSGGADVEKYPIWPVILAIAGLLLFLFGMHRLVCASHSSKRSLFIWGWWLSLLFLRFTSFQYGFPGPLVHLALFSPSEYAASNWLPTLGDLLINTVLLLYSAWLLYEQGKFLRIKASFHLPAVLVFMLLLLGIAWFVGDVIRGLIINSSISLDISDVLNLTTSSYLSFLIIGLLFATLFLLMDRLSRWLSAMELPLSQVLILLLGCTVLLTSIFAFFIEGDPWVIPATALIFLLIYFSRNQSNGFGYARIIGLIISFAFLGTYLLQRYSSEREFEKRKLLAGKISAERDPIAESLFLETEKKILNDSILKTYLRPSTMATGQVRDLAQLYFNSYWEKYSINVNVFGADECPMTALYTTSVSDPLKFDRLIDSIGIPTMSDRFFFMDNGSGRISYMARLPILNENRDSIPLGTLYIDFQSRYTPEEIGYPELLLDKMVSTRTDLSNYSYARYNQGKLISHYGTYPYELSDTLFRKASTDEYSFFKSDKYSHLVYKVRDNSFVILSLPRAGLLGLLTPFSYLILFFSLLVLIPYLWQEFVVQRHLRRISFKRRIQLSIVLILFISLLLIGGGTIVYIISNSNQKNLHNISEKIHSLLVETEYILGKDDGLSPFKSEDIAYALTRQANVFFADINIFDPYGQLYASSRPKIFEEGLVSKKMNPEAYYYLSVRKTSEYIHEEHIGKLNYFSAYVPLRNNENKVIGYLNLPYFARQNELRKEIATFVVAIVNIYVLLIVLVVIAAIFLSNTVTEPLRLIQEKLGNIQLGRKNEVIEWKGQDEIGDLISEYNRMVSELAESADKLARSERESAWREMAKQVAHEIKNPLTPMKLSTQMLKRAWDDEAPGFDQRIERYTQNLIEQIDSLSHIATEFSNFAKMPKMVKEKVDLYALLQGAIDFHQGEQGVNISMDVQCASPCYILTDKEQMLRVFNNLLRNAIQAIPEDKAGLIDVTLKQEGKQYCFSVSDNGTGISDELREKIFSPNFTTKNAGMGLGLAMVKNIVESSEGRIWFESELGKGTVFYVELPQMA
ncbi:MAG: hypothetical protein RLZZ543_1082 [Bacteroidota bacterium]|jgi:signal transduction histidine kinase